MLFHHFVPCLNTCSDKFAVVESVSCTAYAVGVQSELQKIPFTFVVVECREKLMLSARCAATVTTSRLRAQVTEHCVSFEVRDGIR